MGPQALGKEMGIEMVCSIVDLLDRMSRCTLILI
jgi:hypothetical protein